MDKTTIKQSSISWCVYIVQCADGTYYTGSSNNVDRRVKQHNTGKGARYTFMHAPVTLVYHEPHPNRSQAFKREMAIKKLPRAKKLLLIQSFTFTTAVA